MHRHLIAGISALAILAMAGGLARAQGAETGQELENFLGAAPPVFENVDAIVDAFKSGLGADDKDAVSKLLGLDAKVVTSSNEINEAFAEIRDAAAQSVTVGEIAPDRRVLILGERAWPFPFPVVNVDGKWAFDTVAGLEEVVNRRIGENELRTIAAVRGFVEAQEAYRERDWDEDGVLEYAQKLISTPETYDGLYWPSGDGVPESPAGPYIEETETRDDGYFGYRYRILTRQGENVAGGAYDYVINGNMIAGFALIAVPAQYDRTGVMTFVVNQNGTVYEKDLGPDTQALSAAIQAFDPDDGWEIVNDPGG